MHQAGSQLAEDSACSLQLPRDDVKWAMAATWSFKQLRNHKCCVCCLSCFLPHFQHLAISEKFPTLWASSPPWQKTEMLTSQPSLQLRYQQVTCFYQSDSPGEMRLRKDALSGEWLQMLSFRVKSWCRNVLEELQQWIFWGHQSRKLSLKSGLPVPQLILWVHTLLISSFSA